MKTQYPKRPYQVECEEKWHTYVAAGRTRGMAVLATGTGKTVLAAHILSKAKRTLFIAHREELITQTLDTVKDIVDGIEVGIVKAELNQVNAKNLVIASIQTISMPKRLDSLLAGTPFDLIIADECHHSSADSHLRVLNHPRFANVPTLGLTATPERNDERGLAKVWGLKPFFNYGLHQAIDDGWLVPYITDRVVCDKLDMSRIKIGPDGDYDMTETDKEFVRADVSRAVADKIADVVKTQGRKFVVFTPTVDQSERVARWLNELGIASAHIDGETPTKTRRSVLKAHKAGEIQVLSNCSILTEGYDDPTITGICMARPTQSMPFYIQCIGRGARPSPLTGKTDFLILDIVGAHGAHGDTITADTLDEDEKEIKPKEKRSPLIQGFGPSRDGEFAAVVGLAKATVAGIETKGKKKRARVKWLEIVPGKVFAMSAGEQGTLFMRHEEEWRLDTADGKATDADLWRGYRLPKDAWSHNEARAIMPRSAHRDLTCGVVEDRARALGVFGLANENAEWRKQNPGSEQIRLLEKLTPGIRYATKGEASDAISLAKIRKMFVGYK